nr:hypothetical protein StreXyl84_17870 [Streptomyces sp. Xyl84]
MGRGTGRRGVGDAGAGPWSAHASVPVPVPVPVLASVSTPARARVGSAGPVVRSKIRPAVVGGGAGLSMS